MHRTKREYLITKNMVMLLKYTKILQYVSHAKEMSLPIPEVPTLFMKPSSSLADPWPAPTVLPKITQQDNTGDYESEMVIVIGRDAKDVSESEALDYVLGYTAANDVSSRTSQMNQSQWSFSKGFDGACPIGVLFHFLCYLRII